MNDATPPSGLGQRERNKLEKRGRIKAAVRELIESKGFDEMTTREIARHADVGLGTLFSYATNKRDLLFLVFNDEQDQLVDAAYRNIPADLPVVEQLIAVFRPFYELFASEPTFARYLLRELIFYESGAQAARFQQGRRRIVSRVEGMIVAAQEAGRIGTAENGRVIARLDLRGLPGRNPPLAARSQSAPEKGPRRAEARARARDPRPGAQHRQSLRPRAAPGWSRTTCPTF